MVALRGRLGNQLFQISFAHWLSSRSDFGVGLDLSGLGGVEVTGPPAMDAWVRARPVAAPAWWPAPVGRFGPVGVVMRRLAGPSTVIVDESAPGRAPEPSVPSWWFGYWQQVRFAAESRERIRGWFGLRGDSVDPVIRVHVRRGDFVRLTQSLPIEWFRAAIGAARRRSGLERVEFVSDDPGWCAAALLPAVAGAVVAPAGDPVADLTRLARSAVLVGSDSTFSWWAGFLGSSEVLLPDRVGNIRHLVDPVRDPRWTLIP